MADPDEAEASVRLPLLGDTMSSQECSARDHQSGTEVQDTQSPQPHHFTFTSGQLASNSDAMNVVNEIATDNGSSSTTAPADTRPADCWSRIHNEQCIEALETNVKVGIRILRDLRKTLADYKTEDSKHYLSSINALLKRTKKTRCVVGIVGKTGAGKSSVLNAILDEERLLPTNCMRACTASPTELSWNDSGDPSKAYRAEIEFISAEDWEDDLRVLCGDLLDGPGDKKITTAEADIAIAKLQAVYPERDKHELASSNPRDLAQDPATLGILGKVIELGEASAAELYTRIQVYVDSKEKKSRGRKTYGGGGCQMSNSPQMALWPLIKIVRIFTKAPVLETGVVLVDLPGFHDSNAARAAVAEKYLKACNAIWIVAPITRAVDDKTGKKLLGDAFKRQLMFDGTYSAVSFICSQTDEITIHEAEETLNLQEDLEEIRDRKYEIKEELGTIKSTVDVKKNAKAATQDMLHEIAKETAVWKKLLLKCAKGYEVYEPMPRTGGKRKHESNQARARKKFVSEGSDDDDDSDSGSDTASKQADKSAHRLLTNDQIEEKLASLKQRRKQLRISIQGLELELDILASRISNLNEEKEDLDLQIESKCVEGRNEYARDAIQADFAQGIKELDQESMLEKDEDGADPGLDVRDYDAVAKDFPVFCVSAKAYQHFCGRLKDEKFRAGGFATKDATGIPQLQEYAKGLSEAARRSLSSGFLREMHQIINSLLIWTAPRNAARALSVISTEAFVGDRIDNLTKAIFDCIRQCVKYIRRVFSKRLVEIFNKYGLKASSNSVTVSADWGDKAKGGMIYSTYKATTRRNGVYSGTTGPRNLNQDLLRPVLAPLAKGWEHTFKKDIPNVLEKMTKESQKALQSFHEKMIRYTGIPAGSVVHTLLQQQLSLYTETLAKMPEDIGWIVQRAQRDISRCWEAVIREQMKPAYLGCSNECGAGSFRRMKGIMASHIESARHHMFIQASNSLEAQLDGLVDMIEPAIKEQIEDVIEKIKRNFNSALQKHQTDCFENLKSILNEVNHRFAQGDSGTGGDEEDEEEGEEEEADDEKEDEEEDGNDEKE